MSPNQSLHGELGARAVVDTNEMTWQPSPSGTVLRKRLHLVGPAEAGQVTSLVRYLPGAEFPAHDHPEGEEIYVLEGTFSDHQGDAHAGTHLLNPEGFHHAPSSAPGCLIFVKLRQYGGDGRPQRWTESATLPWEGTGLAGVERKTLFSEPRFPDVTCLERWSPDASPGTRELPGGAELFVIEGALIESGEELGAGSWLRLPVGSKLDASTRAGCLLYIKTGGLPALRSSD